MQKTAKLTVLVNNNVYLPGLQAEHGWSLLIETPNGSVLFDLGQSDLFMKNAAVLGCDLGKVNHVVLSHGHYDHTGGLNSFLSLTSGATIYAHPDIFKKRFSLMPGKTAREIGLPVEIQKHRDNFCLNKKSSKIFPSLFLTGEISRTYDTQGINKGLYADPEGKELDDILDEQGIILDTPHGIAVLLGCCHAGLANTLETVAEITGEKKIYMVLGGMHLSKASEEMMRDSAQCLNRFQVQKVGQAHCTGWRGMEALMRLFSGEVFPCDVGTVIEL